MDNKNVQTQKLLGYVTFILVFFLFTRTPLDADFWWHLRAGQVMWTQKVILLNDPFSFTRQGQSWVNAFWLSEIFFYGLYSLGKYYAITAFVSLTGALTFHAIFIRLKGNPFVNCFIILLAAISAAPIWGPRPQIISFLLVAILDIWVTNRKKNTSWVLVPLFALWANLHGGWIWGFLLILAQLAGETIQAVLGAANEKIARFQSIIKLAGWSILAGLAIGFNPNGLGIWRLPFTQVNVSMQIQEWLSPDFHRVDFHPMLWILFILLLLAPLSKKESNWPQLFKVLGFAYLTFVAQRNIALFSIVTAPLLSEWINASIQAFQKENDFPSSASLNPRLSKMINVLLVISLSLAAIGHLFLVSQTEQVDKNYPIKAVQWIKDNNPQGRIFNSYNWGGYLLWNLPDHPVFIDGRADLYGNELIIQWQDVINARENALTILDKWNIQIVILEPDWPIIYVLKQNKWAVVYQDKSSIILIHK